MCNPCTDQSSLSTTGGNIPKVFHNQRLVNTHAHSAGLKINEMQINIIERLHDSRSFRELQLYFVELKQMNPQVHESR